MSGQPYKKRTDIDKYRNEYLDALNLRSQLDTTVHQAVKNYKATGALPAVSQMKDNRTTSEILADTEKLKSDIAGSLAKIADLQFGNAVVQRIIASPLNQDNSLLIFTAQRVNDIVKKLSDLYTYGIKGDTNDVQQIVNFIASMYSDKNALASSTKDFLHNYTTRNIGGFTQGGINRFADVTRLLSSIKAYINTINIKLANRAGADLNRLPELLVQTNDLLTVLIQLVPTSPNVIVMIDTLLGSYIDQGGNEDLIRTLVSYKDFISSGIPNISQVSLAFKKVELYSANFNTDSLKVALVNLMSILLPSEEWNIARLRELARVVNYRDIETAYANFMEGENDNNIPPAGQPRQEQPYEQAGAGGNYGEAGFPPAPEPENPPAGIGGIPEEQQAPPQPQPQEYPYVPAFNPATDGAQLRANIIRMNNAELDDIYNRINELAQNPAGVGGIDYTPILNNINNQVANRNVATWADLTVEQKRMILSRSLIGGLGGYRAGSLGMHGIGLHHILNKTMPKRSRGRPKGSGIRKTYAETVANSISDEGIEPERRFIKFGRYLINSKKLNDGILAIKRPSGNGIAEFPSQRISNNFRKVIKAMIGGGNAYGIIGNNPSFSDLESLSEPERVYLHKLASKADIVDKFNIPTPSKSKYEQDIHEFEVMKGEIMSGNDSKELVKKFKFHILKLSKLGALPKAEVQDILETLVELGY